MRTRPILVMIHPEPRGGRYTAKQAAPAAGPVGTGPGPVEAFADLLAQSPAPGGSFVVVVNRPPGGPETRPGEGQHPPAPRRGAGNGGERG